MRQLFLLVKAGLMERLKWRELNNSKDKKKRMNAIMLCGTFVFLGIIIAVYAASAAFGIIYIGMGELVPLIAVTAVSLMTLFFTTLKTNGILFGYKDYEMLSALPVKTSTLVSSRFLQLYGSNLVFSVLIMLPMGLVYGIFQKEGPVFYIMWFVGILTAPWIPTTIAVIIGALIMAVSARMKHANAISAILSIFLIVAIIILPASFGGMETGMTVLKFTEMLEMLKRSFGQTYPVSLLFYEAIVHKDYLAFLMFVLGSGLWYTLFLVIISYKYKHIQSLLTAHRIREKKHGELNFEAKKPVGALLKKEWKRFLSSNIYLLNMGMGVIMQLLFVFVLFFVPQQKIETFFVSGNTTVDIFSVGGRLLPFILAGISGMSCTSSCSLSLEGKNMEMLKSLPLKPEEIYRGKIWMNLSLTVPPTLISSLLLSLKFGTGIFDVLLLFLIPLVFCVFSAVFGMYMNIRYPNYGWENEATVVKQSVPSFCGIFGAMILALGGGAITSAVPLAYSTAVMFAVAAVTAVIATVLYRAVNKSPLP